MTDSQSHRVALIANGGFDGGHFDQGIPTLVELRNGIREEYDGADFSLHGRSSTRVLANIITAHARQPFALIHGFWGSGAGRVATVAGRLLRIPSVVTLMGGETASIDQLDYGVLRRTRDTRRLRRTCRRAARVVVLSNFQRDLAKNHIDQEVDFQVIPFGVSDVKFAAENTPWKPPWNFLHVANQTEIKDQQTLLEAFRLISASHAARLTIVGPDYLDGALPRLATKLSIDHLVNFAGPTEYSRLPAIYSRSHILLHSSLYESQAVVANEAMASSTAICATRTGLFADLDGDICITSDAGDAQALASNAMKLIENKKLARELIDAGLAWARAHNSHWTLNQYLDIYSELLTSGTNRA